MAADRRPGRAKRAVRLLKGIGRRDVRRVVRLLEGEPLLRDYRPIRSVRVPETSVERAAVPAIDAHCHLGRWLTPDGDWMISVESVLDVMDKCNVRAMVNLDGRWGDELERNLDRYDRAHPGKFATFCHVDWTAALLPGSSERATASLRRSAAAGARGFKVWKDLGLSVRDERGDLVLPDDSRLQDLWETAGSLGLPVVIHTGDPVSFFQPFDVRNERWEELAWAPSSMHSGSGLPTFGRLIDALESVVASHPRTSFIGAHVGGNAEDLAWVDRMLSTYPNFAVDLAGRVNELGRQPRSAVRLISNHSDRILWGSDVYPPQADELAVQFRFLETDDEAFDYSPAGTQTRGRWTVSGLHLPQDVLVKVYEANAARLLGGL